MLRRILFPTLFLIGITIFMMPLTALAQENSEGVALQSLEVDFWPEYDRPEMLVIYRAELDPAVNLPVDVTFRIPARAGAPHAIAAGQSNDSLFTATYDRQVDGEWAYISFNTAMPIIRLEYYDPALNVTDPRREYLFEWESDYAVEQLLLQVQQPCDAANMQISPTLGSGVEGNDGLVYYTGTFGPLSQGQSFELQFSYDKSSDCLSISTLDVVSELPENIPGRVSFLSILPYILGLLGVILIVGGGFWYWQTGRQSSPAASGSTKRGRRSSRPDVETGYSSSSASGGNSIYCHECGKRAGPGDKFCRSCGTRLRKA